MLVVINKDSLMRDGLCGKLHDGRSQLFALQQSSIDSQIFVENLDFCLPYLHSTPPLAGGPCRSIAMTFDMKKARMVWLPGGVKSLMLRLLV